MSQDTVAELLTVDEMLLRHRAHVVRLCRQLTGVPDVAEDLAQETLIEAWRHAHALRDPAALSAWIYGVARNVCRRWLRRERRERAHRMIVAPLTPAETTDWTQNVADDNDLEGELEREELAELLDRALALLPAETRAILIQKYVEDSPQAMIAERFGLSEGAVAMRLQRGKLALRRVLSTDLQAEATAYGLANMRAAEWRETRLWCPLCGQRRLRGRLAENAADFTLECPGCTDVPGGMFIQSTRQSLFTDISSIKVAYSRFRQWSSEYGKQAILRGAAPCLECGVSVPLRRGAPSNAPPQHHFMDGLNVWCDRCRSAWWSSLNGLVLHVPEVDRFWNEHQRTRMLPPQAVTGSTESLFVTRIESLRSGAYLDVLHAADTLELRAVHSGHR